jgi:hypothetical protein
LINPAKNIAPLFVFQQFERFEVADGALKFINDPRLDSAIRERNVSNKLRDLAASAARIFGWDKAPQTNVQVNTLRITAEQLAEIRALRDAEGLP